MQLTMAVFLLLAQGTAPPTLGGVLQSWGQTAQGWVAHAVNLSHKHVETVDIGLTETRSDGKVVYDVFFQSGERSPFQICWFRCRTTPLAD